MKLGLRFDRRDVALLHSLADRVRRGEMGPTAAVGTFEQPARAAQSGEPLEVYCDDPLEVVQMAALYRLHGCHAPVIEELSG